MTSIMMKIPGMQLVQIPVTKNQQGEIVLPPQDNALRVIQLEQNLKFLQEQQQFMLAGLHREIEVLHKRNRDLQFQLVFSKRKHVTGTVTSPVSENITAKRSVNEERLEKEAAVAKGAARSAEARALQLQQLLEAQTEKLKCLQLQQQQEAVGGGVVGAFGLRGAGREGALAARLEEAERLVRRLRAEGELQRRELQAIKNSLTLGMRASTVDNGGFGSRRYRPQNYQFPPLHTGHDYWYSGQRERKSSKNGAKVDSLENRIFGLEQDSEKTSMLPNLMLKTRIPMVHAGKSDSFTNMYVSCRTLASDIDYQDTARHNNGRNRRLTPPMTLPDLQNSHHQSTVYANSNSRLYNPGYQKHKHETKVKSPELVSTDEENPARRPKASIPSDSKSTDEQSADTQRANHRSRGRRNQQQR